MATDAYDINDDDVHNHSGKSFLFLFQYYKNGDGVLLALTSYVCCFLRLTVP